MRKLLFHLIFLNFALMARAEQVVFSEIMYHPAGTKPEFIEIWNITVTPLDMAKWRFTDGVSYEFPDFVAGSPQASFLKPLERIVVSAADEATTRAAYPSIPAGVRIFGPWTGALANSGTRITLSDKNGVSVCSVRYKDGGRWPKAADGTGHSLVLKNENRLIDDYRVWRASNAPDGTPGLPESALPGNPLRFSEAHFAAANSVDWIELQNTSSAPVSAVGLFIASMPDASNKVPLTGDVPANGYASWNLDFPLDPTGNVTLYLVDSANSVVGTVELQRLPGRNSMQAVYPVLPTVLPRWEDVRTTPEWYASVTDTRDAANAPAINTNVVINEIMCDPPSGQTDSEFIELYNKGAVPVSLAGWKLRAAVDFDFPANASIPAGGYVVVTGSSAFIQQTYPGVTVFGDWSGTLGNKGDLIRLIDSAGNLADEVDYHVGGDWPDLAGGSGTSLELINPDMDNSRGSAWRDSDETNKSQFQSYAIPGIFQQLRTLGGVTDYKELHLLMANDGHVVLRNIAVKLGGTGSNLLTNADVISTTGSSATGWLVQGTHGQSYIDGTGDFHLIADGYGDVRPNRAEIDCTALTQGQNYTISFDARWISGTPRVIAQTWDRSIGKPVLLPVPNNLGTPGAVNSRSSATPLPQVDSVLHNPAVPKPTDAVKITARVTSASPLSAVEVVHRIDSVGNANPWVASPMFDDGTNDDAVPGDGVYTATLTQHQVNNRIVQFYVRATADAAATGQSPKEGANRPAMWMVDSRTTPTTLRRQRFIISAYDRAALQTSSGSSVTYAYKYPRLSNHYFNVTFIHNDSEVYYLGELHKSGSPWTRGDSNSLDRGKWKLPDDRIFRNRQKSTWDNDATGGNRHHNRMVRYLLYLCGFPASNQEEFAYTMLNGDVIIIRNDTEPTDNDLLNRVFENGTDGQLIQVEDEWWFDDAWNRINRDADWSYKGTNDPIRYHTEYTLRTRETEYDYSALTELFKSVNAPATTEEQLSRVLDSNFVMMIAAVRGYAGDWDSQTLNRGKNCYLYRKASDGRWMYLHWDSDLAFQSTGEVVVGSRAGWATYANKPFARRVLNYHLTQLVTKFTRNSARTSAWMDAEEAASTAYTIDKTLYLNWFNGREARILQEINLAIGGAGNAGAYTAAFAVTTPPGATTTAGTIDLTGTAPSSAFRVVVDGHPEAAVAWTTQKQWTMTGLLLNTGANTFTLHTIDEFGSILGTTIYTITKADNALPAMRLTAHPASWNVALDEVLTLDAGVSFDPDGGALSFAWSNTPISGVTVSHPTPAGSSAMFGTPGVYSFTATGTDPDGGAMPITREALAFNRSDFSAMNLKTLDPMWALQNIEERDNYSGNAWYSTQDKPGNLLVQVLDDSAKPAAYPSSSHPLITRPLPASADFALQTDLTLDARQTGTFFTGLVVDTVESGTATRYLFGLEGGTTFSVKQSTGGGFSSLASEALPSGAAVLRVRRLGNQLLFQRRVSEVWLPPLVTQTIPDGTTMSLGGIFVATTAAENVRVAFDYIVLADSTSTTTALNGRRITEIMYNPAPPTSQELLAMPGVKAGDFEFIELTNAGTTPLNLGGARFDMGITFVFPPGFTLAPGERTVIVSQQAAFTLRYGSGFNVAGQFAGNLANTGEELRLLDAAGVEALRFAYSPTWYPPTDGGGYSLVSRTSTAGFENYGVPTSWAISGQIGGTPGSEETSFSQTFEGWRYDYFTSAEQGNPLIGAATADPDGDNRDNLAEYAFGKNPRQSGELVTTELSTVIVDGVENVAISFNRPRQALDLTYEIEISSDLLTWSPSGFLAGTPQDLGNGLERVTFAVTGLSQPRTTYHIRPTAFHLPGSRFGDELTFTTPNTNPLANDKTLHAPVTGVATVIYSTTDTSDADGDARTISVLSYSGAGSAISDGTQITFTNGGFTGAETIQVSVSDAYGGSGVATVTLRNEAPVANPDRFTVNAGSTVFNVLANDSDADGDGMTIVSVSSATGGLAITDGATISYTPGEGFGGIDELSYVLGDRRGGEASATVTLVADYSVGRTVATTNEQVPGVSGAFWSLFGVPSIFAEGTEAGWLGSVTMGTTRLNGIFSGDLGAPVMRVRSEDAARDATGAILPQTRFQSFRQPVFAGENFAFIANITGAGISAGNDSGIWVGEQGALRALAREGESAPGTSGAKFKAFTSVAMPGAQTVFFIAKLKPQQGLVTGASDTGLWAGSALALREGQIIDPGHGSLRVKSFEVLSNVKGSPGHGRYDAAEQSVDALITFTNGSTAIATIHQDATIRFVALTGQTDDQGRTPLQLGAPSSPGAGQLPVAITTFGGAGFSKANDVTIFDFAENKIVAQKGTLALGINGGIFEKFQNPVAGYGPEGVRITAFVATVSGASAADNVGLWADTAAVTPSLQLVARKGSAPPDAPGTKFKAFQSISILEGRGPMFTAKLSSGGSRVTAANDQGLWATDSSGVLRLVMREGDPLAGKILRTFRLLEAVPGSLGQRRSWTTGDATATLIYLAYFTDGSSAILTRTIP